MGLCDKTYSPILGLLLLLSVFPLLSVQVVSDCIFCNNQSTSKFVSDGNFSPDGDRSDLNAILSTHTEHGNGELLLPGIAPLGGGTPLSIWQRQTTVKYKE